MDGRIEITEEEVWKEIDEFFRAEEKKDDEYDEKYFMERYGTSRGPTARKLMKLVDAGLMSTRIVLHNSKLTRVWKLSDSPHSISGEEEQV